MRAGCRESVFFGKDMVIIFLSNVSYATAIGLRVDGILLIPVLPESDRDVKGSGKLALLSYNTSVTRV